MAHEIRTAPYGRGMAVHCVPIVIPLLKKLNVQVRNKAGGYCGGTCPIGGAPLCHMDTWVQGYWYLVALHRRASNVAISHLSSPRSRNTTRSLAAKGGPRFDVMRSLVVHLTGKASFCQPELIRHHSFRPSERSLFFLFFFLVLHQNMSLDPNNAIS